MSPRHDGHLEALPKPEADALIEAVAAVDPNDAAPEMGGQETPTDLATESPSITDLPAGHDLDGSGRVFTPALLPDLPGLAAQITTIHSEMQGLIQTNLKHAERLGRLLLEVKAQLAHQQFIPMGPGGLPYFPRSVTCAKGRGSR